MVFGQSKRTLTVNGFSQKVQVIRTEPGANTGDTVYVLEDESGHRSRWYSDAGIRHVPSQTNTGDQWGTLR